LQFYEVYKPSKDFIYIYKAKAKLKSEPGAECYIEPAERYIEPAERYIEPAERYI